jgi:hypothetical protein
MSKKPCLTRNSTSSCRDTDSLRSIERVPAGSGQPIALLRFSDLSSEALNLLRSRIHNMFWKDHTISAQILPDRED